MSRRFTLLLLSASLVLGGELVAQGAEDGTAVGDTLRGRSGKLMARQVGGRRGGPVRILQDLFGDSAVRRHGIYRTEMLGGPLSFINLLPFDAKKLGRIGPYLLGTWPRESRGNRDLPEGFIEVTRENQDTRLSEHFRLRDFLTHDQANVWPKYVVVREPLLDKLELVIADLNARGFVVRRLSVLSGFRTPQYNARGVGRGRASDSRHQYGDAADVFVDNDNDGRFDDLNGDGRINSADVRVLVESVERVERKHPELAGGMGLYRRTSTHGPFVHIDARGSTVRWGSS